MRWMFGIGVVASCLMATAAQALKVTNLDLVPHYVVLESTAGSKKMRLVKPNETIRVLQVGGEVYLKGGTNRLRPDAHDGLVIWREGNLQIQSRRHTSGDGAF